MSKIRLSQEEWALVMDAQVLLRKNEVLRKVEVLLGHIALESQSALGAQLPLAAAPMLHSIPKLSKGENYKGLPYRILDYPRLFSKEDVFACRTLFWWGHTFTFMIHLKGIHLQRYAGPLMEATYHATGMEWRIAMEGEEWEHDALIYPALKSHTLGDWCKKLEKAPFVKWYYPLPLNDWENLAEKIAMAYGLLAGAVNAAHQLPKR